MGAEEGSVKRARQNALLRRHVAENTIASHGGSKRNVMAILSPRAVGSTAKAPGPDEQVKTERFLNPLEAKFHRPSGALSARGREIVGNKAPEKVESATSTLSTKRTSVESIISDSKETRNKGPVERQSILPRGSVLTRGSVLSPRGPGSPIRGSLMRGSLAVRQDLQVQGKIDPALLVETGQVLKRSNSGKVRMSAPPSSFGAFRQAKGSKELPFVAPKLKVQEPFEERVKRLAKRFAFSGEEEVRRVMGYYHTALRKYYDPEEIEVDKLPLQGLRAWLCHFSGLDEKASLGHLLDPEWTQDKCLSEDEFFEWYNSHQWNEEIMVPDPLERRVRHFCRNQGYHITDVERVKHAFDKADKDSSGLLDQHEFAACYAGLVGIHPSEVVESRFRILWEEVDEDKNGTIDLLEFAKWYLRVNPPPGRGPIKAF